MRYVRSGRIGRLRRIFAVQRDQLIGQNFRVHDLMLFNARKPLPRRLLLWGFFVLVAIAARFRGLMPVQLTGGNNYVIVRNAILQSLIDRDAARRLGWSQPVRLLLTEDELFYLRHFDISRRLLEQAGPAVGLR
jgi:hypothetical protein